MTQTEVKELAIKLMSQNNAQRNLIAEGWEFRFSKRKRAIGTCSIHGDKKVIEYSIHFIDNSEEAIKDTILHEMAHALAGLKEAHNNNWKKWCIKLGANPNRTNGDKINEATTKNLIKVAKYTASCPNCKREFPKHKIPTKMESCGHCSPVYNPNYLLNYKTKNGEVVSIKPTTFIKGKAPIFETPPVYTGEVVKDALIDFNNMILRVTGFKYNKVQYVNVNNGAVGSCSVLLAEKYLVKEKTIL